MSERLLLAWAAWTVVGAWAFLWDFNEYFDITIPLVFVSIPIGAIVGPIGWLICLNDSNKGPVFLKSRERRVKENKTP